MSSIYTVIGIANNRREVRLSEGSKVDSTTQFRNPYEVAVRDALESLGIGTYYKPFQSDQFTLPLAGHSPYNPDFVVDLSQNGRRVVLEPHSRSSNKDKRTIDNQKFKAARRTYGNIFYSVMIGTYQRGRPPGDSARVDATRFFVDEMWPICKIATYSETEPRPVISKPIEIPGFSVRVDEQEYEAAKDAIRNKLLVLMKSARRVG